MTDSTEIPTRSPSSRYACRKHYEPVTWRGTGCRQCDNPVRRPADSPEGPTR